MGQINYKVDFKELRHTYNELKNFLEHESGGVISSSKKDIEEQLLICGDDTYELIAKFITFYELDSEGFDMSQHFLGEGELFSPSRTFLLILVLPVYVFLWLLKVLTFGYINFTGKKIIPSFCRKTQGLTFGDMITWYMIGKYIPRDEVHYFFEEPQV